MRRRFLVAFEMAEKAESREDRDAYMTFVVIGGGPTGVELAGMIPATAGTFRKDFRRIDTCKVRVLLLEGSPRVLAAFPEDLSERAKRDLEDLDVEVRTGAHVTRIEHDAVFVGDERIPTRTVFWAAGNAASPLGKMLGAPVDRAGAVQVLPDLSVPGRAEVFVVGDGPRWSTAASRCRGSRRARSRAGATPRGTSSPRSRGGSARRSSTGTRATSPPSGGTGRWRTSAGSSSSAGRWRGSSGCSCTSSTWRGSATG
jgi:NADH dehydrogenase